MGGVASELSDKWKIQGRSSLYFSSFFLHIEDNLTLTHVWKAFLYYLLACGVIFRVLIDLV